MKQFFKIAKDIARCDLTKYREKKTLESLERERLKATCPFCFKIFIEKFSRDRHINNKHRKQPISRVRKSFGYATECSICRKTFYNATNLKRHLRLHAENPQNFPCDICEKKFTRKDSLFRHRERVHKLFKINFDAIRPDSQQSSFQCKMCSADFGASKEALKNHIAGEVCRKRDDSFQLNSEGRIECDLCEKTYIGVSNLKRHINLKHSSLKKRNSCDQCNKFYADISSLKRHVDSIHGSGKQKNVCEICGLEFTQRTSLVRHMKVFHKV